MSIEKISAIAADDCVWVNGEMRLVDLSNLRAQGVHAVQFVCDGIDCNAHVEYVPDPLKGVRPKNRKLTMEEFETDFGFLRDQHRSAMPEKRRHEVVRADRRIKDVEDMLASVPDDEKPAVQAALVRHRKERQEIAEGKRAGTDPGGQLLAPAEKEMVRQARVARRGNARPQ